jgi:hypothetical protein
MNGMLFMTAVFPMKLQPGRALPKVVTTSERTPIIEATLVGFEGAEVEVGGEDIGQGTIVEIEAAVTQTVVTLEIGIEGMTNEVLRHFATTEAAIGKDGIQETRETVFEVADLRRLKGGAAHQTTAAGRREIHLQTWTWIALIELQEMHHHRRSLLLEM